MTEPVSDENYESYLRTSHAEAARNFDRSILTVAAGALGVSATFIINKEPPPTAGLGLLATSWIALVLCLVSLVVSHWTSEKAHWCLLSELDDRSSRWSLMTNCFNAAAMVLLTIGLAGLAGFAWVNVN